MQSAYQAILMRADLLHKRQLFDWMSPGKKYASCREPEQAAGVTNAGGYEKEKQKSPTTTTTTTKHSASGLTYELMEVIQAC